MNKNKTTYPKKQDDNKQFLLIDAEGQVLGRLASRVATLLKGKHKPSYHPAVDMGDHVIIINADKIVMTGKKLDQKMYYRHTGYPGGIKRMPYKELIKKKPAFAVTKAVRGMLPHNSLGRQMLSKLRVYAGPDHPHTAQNPVKYDLN